MESALLQRVQVRNHFLQLLLVKLAAEWRHHASAANNALHHMLVCSRKAAGQVRFLIKLFQPGPLFPLENMRNGSSYNKC